MQTFVQFCEARSEFEVLKQNKKPLEDNEKKVAVDAGCVWHFTGKPSCAIWKAKDTSGKQWFISNTHRAYSKDATLDKAIKRWHSYVKPSA